MTGDHITGTDVTGSDVVALCRDFEAAAAPVWLMGGWGVDALLGRQTRPHHDVDVLVEVRGVERLRLRLIERGFAFKYVWDDEVRWIRDESWTTDLEQPTAFVYADPDGREVDVHVVRQGVDGAIEMLWNVPYSFTAEGLGSIGEIDGHRVRCLSAELQRQAHTGYPLPPHHARDLELLAELNGD